VIRIGIVDDHAIFRAGLRQVLETEADLRVVAEGSDGREALDIVRAGSVDVLLLDLSMRDQGGVEALAAIRARAPQLPVIILSSLPEAHYAVPLIRQGASAYLNKECDPSELAAAVRSAARGRRYITPAVAELLADDLAGAEAAPHLALSERELQVFLRLARGQTVGDVAEQMCLSVKTVSTYRTRVMEKLGFRSNSDLTYYALKNGLIE
jgi:DNA-binding NarL/FixJ family response regulator